MAVSAFKVVQFIVLLNNKEGDPVQNERNRRKYVLNLLFFILWACFFFLCKKPFSEVVNWDDAQKMKLNHKEGDLIFRIDFGKNKPIQNRRSRKNVWIDDMAPNAFKVLQFIVLLKIKEGDPI